MPAVALLLFLSMTSLSEAQRSRQAGSVAKAQVSVKVYGSGFSPADQKRAAEFFEQAESLCASEGGRLWGVSLCGPIAIVNPATRAIATNEPPPESKRPAAFGFANAALEWGGQRWTTLVWQQMLIADEQGFGVGYLMLHELFHRIQPQLGLLLPDSNNDHLDTLEGRYWVQLEGRALETALRDSGQARVSALRDALAFRTARRKAFPQAAESERVAEINEGLAEYTGLVAGDSSGDAAVATRAIRHLKWVLEQPTFVRPFGYGFGAAYGALLETWHPGWTRQFRATDDLTSSLMEAARLRPTENVNAASERYGGAELRIAEERRKVEREARLAELRQRFVEGPVLVIPRASSFSFAGDIVPLTEAGSVYSAFRAQVEWGSLEAENVLVAAAGGTLKVPAPVKTEGSTLTGQGWKLTLAPGWSIRPGTRPGDFQVIRIDRPASEKSARPSG